MWTQERFFAEHAAPENYGAQMADVERFVARHSAARRRVVLVTSGGTTAPLERNVVRYLDNFSAGTRGATSAEYFLAHGYAVVFMSRQHSQAPFTRLYSHTTNPFFDLLEEPVQEQGATIRVADAHVPSLLPVLRSFHEARRSGSLLAVSFVSVVEYLFLLRGIACAMRPLGRLGMFYLAAAVSDFFMPDTHIPEHKIQSDDGSLVLRMEQVPKVLGVLVHEWAPDAFVVSFKLETDDELLIPKAEKSLARYAHSLVIGNHLHKRKHEVVLVAPRAAGGAFEHEWIRVYDHEIELDIVAALAARHGAHIAI